MADKIEIVRLDAEGNVKETLHDFGGLVRGAGRVWEIATRRARHGRGRRGRLPGVASRRQQDVDEGRGEGAQEAPVDQGGRRREAEEKPAAKKTEDEEPAEDGEPR